MPKSCHGPDLEASAGLSLEGATLRPDGDANRDLYNQGFSNREILEGDVRVPRAARPLITALNQYSAPGRKDENVSESLKQRGRATLGAVHFESGKSDITSDSEVALSDFAKTLKDNPTWSIRVEGYIDIRGNAEANRKLSEDRAQAVVTWLTQHGIDESRLTAKGYGQSRPSEIMRPMQGDKRIAALKSCV